MLFLICTRHKSILLAAITFILASCNSYHPEKVDYRLLEDSAQLICHIKQLKEKINKQTESHAVMSIRIAINTSRYPDDRSSDYLTYSVAMYGEHATMIFLDYDSRSGWSTNHEKVKLPVNLFDESKKEETFDISLIKPQLVLKAVKYALADERKKDKPSAFVNILFIEKKGIGASVGLPGYRMGTANGGYSIGTDLNGNLIIFTGM